MPFYAQINTENICAGVSELHTAITDPRLIPIPAFDAGLIGKYWDGQAFATPTPAPESPEQIAARLERAVDAHLDAAARLEGYDNIVNACGYAAAPNPFQAESQSFVSWRGNVWATCYRIYDEVAAETRPLPTEAELIALLPARV